MAPPKRAKRPAAKRPARARKTAAPKAGARAAKRGPSTAKRATRGTGRGPARKALRAPMATAKAKTKRAAPRANRPAAPPAPDGGPIAPPPAKYDPDALERDVIRFWDENGVFARSVEQRADAEPFVFLEGPPTANGLPHAGHVLTRTLKDAVCRYQAMRGAYVQRKAGWDCHGLPVEIEVEKELGLRSKGDIERYGIEAFNRKCRESVFRYRDRWVEMSRRVGFWLDFDDPYVTMDNAYVESVWWSLKRIWDKGLLYKGYRVTPHCPRCGTALSSHEVAQGYREVEDPSLFVKFRVAGEPNVSFLAWTTTPWTLVSNVALAVNPKASYVRFRRGDETLIMAEARFQALYAKDAPPVEERFEGSHLVGKSYEPLYRYVEPDRRAWEVVAGSFVSLEDGTGIVHMAPAFGEDDYRAGVENGLAMIQLVDLEGKFKPEARDFAGLWIKDADPRIIEDLRARGLVEGQRTLTHAYPFCWRCDTPLLYYARESWFIAMTKLRDTLLENNRQVAWYPDHVRDGRFGDFLREVRDWALSRDRYWGTPLPLWTCEGCGKSTCVGGVAELRERARNPEALEPLDLHKPFLDRVQLRCEHCRGTMHRERAVIDAWYDSGAAPFAQWHHPWDQGEFQENFPVDFICEGLDQTRGWFYSLMAIGTALFERPAYKAVAVNGLVLDKDGQKMSKSRRNYTDPDDLFRTLGADAVRWNLLSTSALWQPKRFFEEAVREALSRFSLTLWNTYAFLATYASLDRWDPRTMGVPLERRPPLDRWLASRTTRVAEGVEQAMAKYELHKATRLIEEFLVQDLSNWWLRRSRRRFWTDRDSEGKRAAFATLHEALLAACRLAAPFAPFLPEFVWGKLRVEGPDSVHLTDYPRPEPARADLALEAAMEAVRRLAETGRALRAKAAVKVRHPLPEAFLVLGETGLEPRGTAGAPKLVNRTDLEPLVAALADELNVKKVTFVATTEPFLTVTLKGNPGALGPKFRARAKAVAEAVAGLNPERAHAQLLQDGAVRLDVGGEAVELGTADLVVTKVEKEGYALGATDHGTLVLDTRRSPDLMAEGLARELVRRIQEMRKELGLSLDARIATTVEFRTEVEESLDDWEAFIRDETRSASLRFAPARGDLVKEWDVDGDALAIGIAPASRSA